MSNLLNKVNEIVLILLIQLTLTYVVIISIHRTNPILIFAIYELASIVFAIAIFKIGRKKYSGETWWKVIFGFDLLIFVLGLPIFLVGIIMMLLNYG